MLQGLCRKTSIDHGTKPSNRPSCFWPALWLACLLVAAKTSYLWHQASPPPQGVWPFLAALSAISHGDVLFAAGVGVFHRLALALFGARPSRTLDRVFWTLYLGSAVYGVVNLEVFGFFLTPLTYPLLSLAGDWQSFLTSITPFLTAPSLVAGLACAVLSARLVSVSHRLAAAMDPAKRKILQVAIVAAAVGWIWWGHYQLGSGWNRRIDRRIAENAHWTFLASALASAAGDAPVALADPVLAADRADFSTVAERATSSPQAGLLKSASLGQSSPWRHAHVKNVILVVMESLSARSLEIYGSPYPATPNLTEEAHHALVFDNFYSPAGRSSDALAAILLSVQPRMSWRDVTSDYPKLPGGSLAELVADRGYRTGFLTSSDLGWADWKGFLDDRGYDTVVGGSDLECGEPLTSWGVEDRCLVDGMIRWLGKDSAQPFFLMAWTVQTHHPYEPTPGLPFTDYFGGQLPPDDYDLGRYLNVLHETDRQLGRLFTALRERGLDQDTLVVLVGDHGEAFGQPHEVYGHGTAIYEENVHVPMLLWSPRLFPRGGRSPIIGSHVDLNQTIADLIGVAPAGSWQGRSLFDPAHPSRAYFFVANDNYLLGLRDGRWKYMLDVTNPHEELYDVRSDPDERSNLAKVHPDVCRRLRQRLSARVEADRRWFAPQALLHGEPIRVLMETAGGARKYSRPRAE